MRAPRALTALAIPIALSACGLYGGPRGLFGEDRAVLVEVVNRNASDARLHALYGGGRHPLGTAPADSTTFFRIPWREYERALRIEFELVSEQRPCITDIRVLDPGAEITLTIEARVRYLRWCERQRN
jgi:hypothetical protein